MIGTSLYGLIMIIRSTIIAKNRNLKTLPQSIRYTSSQKEECNTTTEATGPLSNPPGHIKDQTSCPTFQTFHSFKVHQSNEIYHRVLTETSSWGVTSPFQ